ncbi:MAG: SagB/ThcOx family dehydrogenase [Bacteroidales bacterium]|nr:SagB/ThcOx family dehydrogenase [Bacteroidales bacterium]
MKLIKLTLTFIIVFTINNVFAQNMIKLPEPDKTGGKPLMQALNERSSSRDFIDKELTDQQLSNLLWAAFGINREETNKRTAPSSHNNQDIEIYLTTKNGLFLYKSEEHALEKLSDVDMRSVAGKQNFVKEAAVNLIYVSDFKKLGNASVEIKRMTAATHCGFIGQNVYLYCASEGLISVFRAWINKEKIAKELNLPENYEAIYSQSVGYSK